MSFSKIPPEILYEFIAPVVAGYIDAVITAEPRITSEQFNFDDYLGPDVPDVQRPSSGNNDDISPPNDREFSHSRASTPSHSSDSGSGDEADWEDESDYEGYDTLDELSDVSTDVGDDSASEVSRDSVEYEYDHEDLKEAIETWAQEQQREGLPQDLIAPLLSVNRAFRRVTLRVLKDALGVTTTEDGGLSHNPLSLLMTLRSGYRIAHIDPFLCGMMPKYPINPLPPLVETYSQLSLGIYALRSIPIMARMRSGDVENPLQGTEFDPITTGFDFMKSLKYAAYAIPQAALRPWVAHRARIYNVRLRTFFSVCKRVGTVMETYGQMFTIVNQGSRNFKFVLDPAACVKFRNAVENLAKFDQERMGREPFCELPGLLVKTSSVREALKKPAGLKNISEFRKNEDTMAASLEARKLLDKWKARRLVHPWVRLDF